MENSIKTIKGFNSKLMCRDFQYEIGKTYEQDGAIKACSNGFHAIKADASPLAVFGYYPPVGEKCDVSRYCEVEAGGKIDEREDKIACSQIKIGAEIGIPGLVKAHVEWVKKNLKKEDPQEAIPATNTGYQSAATNTGDYSAASVEGKDSVAIATGYQSKAKGALGCAIVVAERGEWNGETYPLIGICATIVDGVKIKADTWYTVKAGKFVEAE